MQKSAPAAATEGPVSTGFLLKFMWLSLATAVATVGIKSVAAYITGSVGLMSDAMESVVNLVAAIVALWALNLSAKPADHNHDFGHGKAEYMSSAVEGALIFVAAGGIIYGAIQKLLHPEPLEQLGFGLLLSLFASLLNLGTGLLLIRTGTTHRSITLEADGRHLMTDVVTSIGVLAALGLIFVTKWEWLDPVIAIAVGFNILFTGYHLIRRSVVGLLDSALPAADVEIINGAMGRVMDGQASRITGLRTRESGRQRFIEAIVEVPGDWTVRRGHDLTERLEHEIEASLPGTEAVIHVEPLASSDASSGSPTEVGDQGA